MTDPTSTATPGDGTRAFQVDLRGIVDLLARHLYSGPRAYLRELLQNAVDAITARHALDAGAPGRVRLRCTDDGALEVADTGIGLTLAEAEELLATIGGSSESAVEGFAMAGEHRDRAMVASELIAALRGLGRDDEADAVTA